MNPIDEFNKLTSLFPEHDAFAEKVEYIPASTTPEPYKALLVHEYHMTVAMEEYHRCKVDVKVLDSRLDGEKYARKILLTLRRTGRVVQFGIVRVNLGYCSEAVRQRIVEGKTPFGRILIEHNVLRRIEPTAFLRVTPSPAMMEWFGLDRPRPTYGRLALIHCDEQPAVELLEIVAPE